jgi:hypothetical protein
MEDECATDFEVVADVESKYEFEGENYEELYD